MPQESKYAYDEESVKAIIEWAQTTQLPKEVMLSEAEHIIDTSMYVNANICDIKQHNSYLLCVTYPGFRRDFFHLGPSFYKNSLKSRREFQKSSCLYCRIRYIVLV